MPLPSATQRPTRALPQQVQYDEHALLFYNPTNFSTHIKAHDDRGNEVPERGNAKDLRTDLRFIGLALLASRDHGVPLLHRTYPGNQSDYPLFRQEVPRIRRWLE